ncbi:MAG: TetR family transcriptional regulator [Candidatus Promineifilaceae bacterium]|nr:TetR family transcriptional regulator [Candidatus Promineifilaceae bacterium]
MRRTKEEALQTRNEILDAALAAFSREGYERARLQDIARAADVTRGAIYHHFGSKEGLFVALVEDASDLANKALERAFLEGGSVVEIIGNILIYSLSLLEEDRRFRQIMALSLMNLSAQVPAYEQQRYEDARELVKTVAAGFQAGIDNGELRADVEPTAMARALLAYQNGLIFLWLSNRDAFSIKESAPTMAELFLRGIVARA